MRVEISRSVIDAICAAAAADRAEICGLLFGTDAAITGWRQAANVHPDPARHFEIAPAALIAALRAERAGGERLIGYVHSHPGGRADPSPTDAANAAPDGRLWLIVGGGGQARLWRATTRGFVPVELATSPVAAT
ncbi:Mov34/MPN/PAD-1 family protein [Sphingomonas sp.]|uniref:Mov34/MPN/PAD-1 family protein n=1 Tax=Sphingomonas sp. TaxID=28214 RepID=UPI002D1DF12C|nr:Mov34/MPN/PAD-1 family protein [Sphingomonas sp.]HWK36179.1 Mov34/MPN/PAD-1 family protein [Sphingomonas sp.]